MTTHNVSKPTCNRRDCATCATLRKLRYRFRGKAAVLALVASLSVQAEPAQICATTEPHPMADFEIGLFVGASDDDHLIAASSSRNNCWDIAKAMKDRNQSRNYFCAPLKRMRKGRAAK